MTLFSTDSKCIRRRFFSIHLEQMLTWPGVDVIRQAPWLIGCFDPSLGHHCWPTWWWVSSGGQVTAHLLFLASSLTPLSGSITSKRLFLLPPPILWAAAYLSFPVIPMAVNIFHTVWAGKLLQPTSTRSCHASHCFPLQSYRRSWCLVFLFIFRTPLSNTASRCRSVTIHFGRRRDIF